MLVTQTPLVAEPTYKIKFWVLLPTDMSPLDFMDVSLNKKNGDRINYISTYLSVYKSVLTIYQENNKHKKKTNIKSTQKEHT